MNGTSFNQWLSDSHGKALVMGIVNVTPDSFSDGGQFAAAEDAIAHACALIKEGADMLDLGGESTRPGAQRISADEQLSRLLPVIEGIRRYSDITLSVDTTLSAVGRAAIAAGANVLNDISAGLEDPGMLLLAAHQQLPIILMHMQGKPATMQNDPVYVDVTREVSDFLAERARAALAAGVPREKIILDPGIGFGKTVEHNLQLLRELSHLERLGFPLLIGTSRKRFIGSVTGVEKAADRLIGSCVSATWAITRGARIVRVHDVKATVQAARMIEAITGPRQNGQFR